MPTEVGAQTVIHIRYVDVWLDPGLRRDDGLFALFPLPASGGEGARFSIDRDTQESAFFSE